MKELDIHDELIMPERKKKTRGNKSPCNYWKVAMRSSASLS